MSQTETTTRTDAELITAIRKGDRELFRELVERHGTRVFGIAWLIWESATAVKSSHGPGPRAANEFARI